MARKANKKQKLSPKKQEVKEEPPKEKEQVIEEEAVEEKEVDLSDNEEMVEEEDAEQQEDAVEQAEEEPEVPTFVSDGRYRNKQRCLVLCSRGVTARYRHLLEDLRTLMPHHKKESKLDPGPEGAGRAVNDILQMRSCNSVLFLECRKKQDCYLWLGLAGGPSARFHVSNIHTMDEMRLTGNCMKGSRPILSFDDSFTRYGHLKVLKELFVDVFGTPRGHPKSKPFVDRVMAFYYADKKIWVRNYQILEQQAENAMEAHITKKQLGQDRSTSMVEIGPRFVLDPIRVFRGSFGGQTLYLNPDYRSPNEIRSLERRDKGNAYVGRKESQRKRKERTENIVVPENPL
eukprot:CAMPEP_0119016068 /NCGR_PEP_ID=MMETSP1176-20130426/11798_1 /TAXON_ID=265551 /ORGANISM="Synedropsis recta cf, Strain CCMP1620" /LENGTH=344 /DNA_ID=CAMNT_0006969395 /DNA_START=24 /DNA_END=1055 /DNA_ORIENTATION=-